MGINLKKKGFIETEACILRIARKGKHYKDKQYKKYRMIFKLISGA